MELPTPLMVPATPFVDGRELDRACPLPALFALDLERGAARPLDERLELGDALARRVGARFAEFCLRVADLPLVRVERADFARERVFVGAKIFASLRFQHSLYNNTLPWVSSDLPPHARFESFGTWSGGGGGRNASYQCI
jgi:hypothetical protein